MEEGDQELGPPVTLAFPYKPQSGTVSSSPPFAEREESKTTKPQVQPLRKNDPGLPLVEKV